MAVDERTGGTSRVVELIRLKTGALTTSSAAARITAYIYGNILVLAAMAGLDDHARHSSAGVLVVLGTALSTFVAHVLAHSIGHQVEHPDADPRDPKNRLAGRESLRDSVPILSSGLLPALLLAAGWWHWISAEAALWLAGGLVVLRIAAIGAVVVRLTNQDRPLKAVFGGLALAVVAGLVVVLKVTLSH